MNNDKLKATIEILEQGIKELITSERWTFKNSKTNLSV